MVQFLLNQFNDKLLQSHKAVKKPVPFNYHFREMTLDPRGLTPLMLAVCSSFEHTLKESLVDFLLKFKSDYKVCSPNGDNLLHLCINYVDNRVHCINLLKSLDINLSDKNAQGVTPLDISISLERTTLTEEIKELMI